MSWPGIRNNQFLIFGFGITFLGFFYFFQPNLLHVDEANYLKYSFTLDGFIKIFKMEGKEFLPIFILSIFQIIFGHTIESGRVLSHLLGLISLVCFIRAFKQSISMFHIILLFLSSTFFILYSLTVFYEVYLIFFSSLTIFFTMAYLENKKHSKLFLFLSIFFGMLTKSNFLILAVILPLIYLLLILEHKNWIQNFLKFSFLTFLSIFSSQAVFFWHPKVIQKYIEMKLTFGLSMGEILSNLFHLDDRDFLTMEILFNNVGMGILVGIVIIQIFLLLEKKYRYLILINLILIITFLLNSSAPRWIWARYLIMFLPMYLTVYLIGFSLIKKEFYKKICLYLVFIVSIHQCIFKTSKVFFDIENAELAYDEKVQYIHGGSGSLGFISIRNILLDLTKEKKAQIYCSGFELRNNCELLSWHYPRNFSYKTINNPDDPEIAYSFSIITSKKKLNDLYNENLIYEGSSENDFHIYLVRGKSLFTYYDLNIKKK